MDLFESLGVPVSSYEAQRLRTAQQAAAGMTAASPGGVSGPGGAGAASLGGPGVTRKLSGTAETLAGRMLAAGASFDFPVSSSDQSRTR